MAKDATQHIECFQCKRLFPSDTMISGELIRPALAELILKRLPDWTPAKMLCPDCLHLFRSEYVEDALTDEKGELSRLDREVLQSLKEQETVTENLNVAFEKDLTLGQYIADRVAAFGGRAKGGRLLWRRHGPPNRDRISQRAQFPIRPYRDRIWSRAAGGPHVSAVAVWTRNRGRCA